MRLSRLGDELLAHHVARGSDRAFAVLYERYHQQLYRYCRSILRDDSDAQDALQSAFTAGLAALRRNQRNAPLRPWLYRIAHNEAVSLIRRRGRNATINDGSTEHLGAVSSAEQEVAQRARWRSLVEDLGHLPERQRAALVLRELSGLSHEEIALSLGTTTATAKQSIFEARQSLAEIEEGRSMSCEDVRQRISEGDRRLVRGRRIKAHLRECAACEAFALAIPARQAQLRALTPGLPPAAAAALLTRALEASCAHGGAGAGGASAALTATTKAAGAAFSSKALAGIALVATTAVGVADLDHVLAHRHAAPHPVSRLAKRRPDSAIGRAALVRTDRKHVRGASVQARQVRADPGTRRHGDPAAGDPRAVTALATASRATPRQPGPNKAVARGHGSEGGPTRSATRAHGARSATRTSAARSSTRTHVARRSSSVRPGHPSTKHTRQGPSAHARSPTAGSPATRTRGAGM